MKRDILIVGAGEHASVVIDAIRKSGAGEPFMCVDDDRELEGRTLMGVGVCSWGTLAKQGDGRSIGFVVGVGGGDRLGTRVGLYDKCIELGHRAAAVVHPAATVASEVTIGEGTLLAAGAIVNPFASIGVNAIINTGAIVEHDCVVGDHAHVAPGAMLAGGVTVGEAAMVGMGAAVRQGVTIGDRAIGGMGAVVTKDVAPGAVVVGCPARER